MKTGQANREQSPKPRSRKARRPGGAAPSVVGDGLPPMAGAGESERLPTPETRDPSAENSRLATEALHRFANAERLEKTPASDFCSGILARHEARRERERIPELLEPGPLVSAAGEAIPALGLDEISGRRDTLVDTSERPMRIGICASEQRMRLLERAGVLHAGTDLVATIGAKNSVEKMLAHQMAAAHNAAMTLVAQISAPDLQPTAPEVAAIVARTGNTAARLMDVCANTALTIQRLRTGGTQRVVVQHQQLVVAHQVPQVTVSAAPAVNRGRRVAGRAAKNAK